MKWSWSRGLIVIVVTILFAPLLVSASARTEARTQTDIPGTPIAPSADEQYAQRDDSITSPLLPEGEVSQASIVDQGGYYGSLEVTDSSSTPGTSCYYEQRNGASYVDVSPRTVRVWGVYYDAYQVAAAEVTVYEEMSDGSFQLVGSSGIYTGTVSYYTSVLLDVPDIRLPIGRNYYVVYDFAWFFPGTTVLDGYRTYFVDYYKSYYYSNSGSSQSSVTTACKPPRTASAKVTLDKAKSKYNGWVTASLTGFAPNSAVTLSWPRAYEATSGPYDGQFTTFLASGTTDGSGSLTLRFRTPLEPLGDYPVTATDGTNRTSTTTLRVIPRIMLNETSGPSNTRLRVYFYGFAAGEVVEVRWHTTNSTSSAFTVIKRITVADNGRASTLVPIPGGQAPGEHLIVGKVVGVSRSASTTFELTGVSAAEEVETTGRQMPTPAPTGIVEPTMAATSTVEPSVDKTVAPTIDATATPAVIATVEPTVEPTEAPTDVPPPAIEPTSTETPVVAESNSLSG